MKQLYIIESSTVLPDVTFSQYQYASILGISILSMIMASVILCASIVTSLCSLSF